MNIKNTKMVRVLLFLADAVCFTVMVVVTVTPMAVAVEETVMVALVTGHKLICFATQKTNKPPLSWTINDNVIDKDSINYNSDDDCDSDGNM